MKIRAAVAVAAGKPLEIMEVDLEGPRESEVLVEIGICQIEGKSIRSVWCTDDLMNAPRALSGGALDRFLFFSGFVRHILTRC